MSKCNRNTLRFRGSAWLPLNAQLLSLVEHEDSATLRRLVTVAIEVAVQRQTEHMGPLTMASWRHLMEYVALRARTDLATIYTESTTSWDSLPDWTIQFTFDYWANTMTDINVPGTVVVTLAKEPLSRGVFIQWR